MKKFLRSAPGRLMCAAACVFFVGAAMGGAVGVSALSLATIAAVCLVTFAVGLGNAEFPRATVLSVVALSLALLPMFWLFELIADSHWFPTASAILFALALGPGINAVWPSHAGNSDARHHRDPLFARRG